MSKKSKRKTHAEQLEELDRKIWARKKNLGQGEGPAGDWTLCNMGPKNDYLNLTSQALKKLDAGDIKGFWKEAGLLVTDENVEHILKDIRKFYHDLIKGLVLVSHREDVSAGLIAAELKRTRGNIKAELKKSGRDPDKMLGAAWLAFNDVVSAIEKNFQEIENAPAYIGRAVQNRLLKLLADKKARQDIIKDFKLEDPLDIDIEKITLKKIERETRLEKLTGRQKQIYKKLQEQKTQRKIAAELDISTRTVRRELEAIKNVIKNEIKN